MSSKTEQILSAVQTALAGTTGVSTRIYRDRWEALARNEMPALVIHPEMEDQTVEVLPYTRSTLTIQVDVLISGSPLSTLADPTRVSLHSKLMADPTLGGLAIDVRANGVMWDAESGEIGILRCNYQISFRTRTTDLTQ
jgi:hypothetical protein